MRKNVNVRRWRVIAVLVGVIMILSGLLVLAWNSYLIVFTRYLAVTDISEEDGDYAADVLDNGFRVADIFVSVPRHVYSTTIPVIVSVWHEDGTRLNSLRLVFSSDDVLSMGLKVPGGYPWPSLEFHRLSDGKGVIFYVADLGFQGTGTVTLEFSIEMFQRERLDLNVNIQFTMQRTTPLKFSREFVETEINTQTRRV